MSKPRRIFVISDLHLGGSLDRMENGVIRLGTQICRAQTALRNFVDWIAASDEFVELVINGDLVDFLAVKRPSAGREWISDQDVAIRRLKRIVKQSRLGEERGPFEALRDFTKKGHSLVLILGNHDVELALPRVREYLAELVAPGGGRVQFVFDGEAYVRGGRMEGGRRIGGLLIEHGNRYDPWNIIDFTRLRQECSHVSRNLPENQDLRRNAFFAPPAGTLLVIHAINHFLPEYPFLNLLKPETGAVVPLLQALRPNLWPLLDRCFTLGKIPMLLYRGRLKDKTTPYAAANIGARGSVSTLSGELRAWLGPEKASHCVPLEDGTAVEIGAREEVQSAYEWLRARASEVAAAARARVDDWRAEQAKERRAGLLIALRALSDDRSFDLDVEQPNYLGAATDLAQAGFSHIVFGHTHLPKCVPIAGLPDGRTATYFNTGTWADIIRVPEDIFSSDEAKAAATFDAFFDAMKAGLLGDHLQRSLTYLDATMDEAGGVTAKLVRYEGQTREPREEVS